jgi:hypothetical protein
MGVLIQHLRLTMSWRESRSSVGLVVVRESPRMPLLASVCSLVSHSVLHALALALSIENQFHWSTSAHAACSKQAGPKMWALVSLLVTVATFATSASGQTDLLVADRLIEFSWRTFANPRQASDPCMHTNGPTTCIKPSTVVALPRACSSSRLWQSTVASEFNPIFARLPLASVRVHALVIPLT